MNVLEGAIASERGAVPGRVLVVDEDAACMREALCALRGVGYEVVGCTSSRGAILAIVGGGEYDVVLCDVGVETATPMGFHDQVAAIDPALAERIVWMATEPSRTNLPHPPLAKPLDTSTVRTCIDEFVVHRTLAPPTSRDR